tara:strand:+ start:2080 stop:3069 length:990 start_codon:yes stop_codon:yes gene_type:complete
MIDNILIYNSGGGIGDSIQILRLIETLKSELKDTNFSYLSAHNNHFNLSLKDYKCQINSLDLNVKYFGFRWWHALIVKKEIKKKNISKFDLIIDLQSKIRNSLILKTIPHKYFISSSLNFKLSKPSLSVKKDKKINYTILKSINLLFKKNYQLAEFDINKIDKKIFDESKRLLPKNNYVGFSITQGNVYRKKEWPLENVIELSKILIKNNKKPVFLIEKKNQNLKNKIKTILPEALFPEHETEISSPALVTCLGKKLDFAITIDNGIMHMLSLAKVPMISLFGPTDSEKFAPDYNNSIVLDSKKLYNNNNVSSISVEDVLLAAKQLVNS